MTRPADRLWQPMRSPRPAACRCRHSRRQRQRRGKLIRSHQLHRTWLGAGACRSVRPRRSSRSPSTSACCRPGPGPPRLALDIMVAPDGAGERAVVSVFVNERLLGSAVGADRRTDAVRPAAPGRPRRHHRQCPRRHPAPQRPGRLPFRAAGLSGADPRHQFGACWRPPSAVPHDFSDLAARWADGVEILVPARRSRPSRSACSARSAPCSMHSRRSAAITVKHSRRERSPAPEAPFIGVGDAARRRRAARAIRPRAGSWWSTVRTARCSISAGSRPARLPRSVMAGEIPGLWIKPLAADGTLPAPAELHLEHGDVAFIDQTGVAMAMSTERDTLVRIAYPDAGVLADGGGAVPFLDHRRPVAARDLRASCSGCRGVLRRRHRAVGPRNRAAHAAALASRPRAGRPTGRAAHPHARPVRRSRAALPNLERASRPTRSCRAIGSPRRPSTSGIAYHYDLPFVDLVDGAA